MNRTTWENSQIIDSKFTILYNLFGIDRRDSWRHVNLRPSPNFVMISTFSDDFDVLVIESIVFFLSTATYWKCLRKVGWPTSCKSTHTSVIGGANQFFGDFLHCRQYNIRDQNTQVWYNMQHNVLNVQKFKRPILSSRTYNQRRRNYQQHGWR